MEFNPEEVSPDFDQRLEDASQHAENLFDDVKSLQDNRENYRAELSEELREEISPFASSLVIDGVLDLRNYNLDTLEGLKEVVGTYLLAVETVDLSNNNLTSKDIAYIIENCPNLRNLKGENNPLLDEIDINSKINEQMRMTYEILLRTYINTEREAPECQYNKEYEVLSPEEQVEFDSMREERRERVLINPLELLNTDPDEFRTIVKMFSQEEIEHFISRLTENHSLQIRTLWLNGNSISRVNIEAPNLTSLELMYNNLSSVSLQTPKLDVLEVAGNDNLSRENITKIDSEIRGLSHIQIRDTESEKGTGGDPRWDK